MNGYHCGYLQQDSQMISNTCGLTFATIRNVFVTEIRSIQLGRFLRIGGFIFTIQIEARRVKENKIGAI